VNTEKFIAYKYDSALGQLISGVLPQKVGIVGFVLAALLGAVVSSLAAMLNAASTIFTMDVFKRFIKPMAGQTAMVLTGRISVLVFSAIAIFLAPNLGNPKISNSIFTIIQESQGFISPGILAAFVFGLFIRKAPRISGIASILTNIIGYGAIKLAIPQIQFLNRMAVCFVLCVLVMSILTIMRPLKEPMEFKVNTNIDLKSSRGAKIAGVLVIILTVALYIIFSPLIVAR
jgi:SSS family solute:Na+ symporter